MHSLFVKCAPNNEDSMKQCANNPNQSYFGPIINFLYNSFLEESLCSNSATSFCLFPCHGMLVQMNRHFFDLGPRCFDRSCGGASGTFRGLLSVLGLYTPNTVESCKGAHTGGSSPFLTPFTTLLYYQQTIQFQSFKTILHLDTLRVPGTAPPLLLLINPSFLNPITTLSASGEAPLADAAMSVEDPSQRKG